MINNYNYVLYRLQISTLSHYKICHHLLRSIKFSSVNFYSFRPLLFFLAALLAIVLQGVYTVFVSIVLIIIFHLNLNAQIKLQNLNLKNGKKSFIFTDKFSPIVFYSVGIYKKA